MNALSMLRASTAKEHRWVEQRPFSLAMLQGQLQLRQYAGWLSCLQRFHDGYEQRISVSTDASLVRVRGQLLPHVPLLRADLEALEMLHGPCLFPKIQLPPTLLDFPKGPREEPFLLGVIYTMEGSALGAQVLRPRLRDALSLPEETLHYYTGRGQDTRRHFAQVTILLNELLQEENDVQDAIQGACWAFATLGSLMEELWQQTVPRLAQVS